MACTKDVALPCEQKRGRHAPGWFQARKRWHSFSDLPRLYRAIPDRDIWIQSLMHVSVARMEKRSRRWHISRPFTRDLI